MKARDIKVGCVYYVDFEPVKRGEFNKKHLAVVIKKNVDEITFVVVPMTSKSSGVGINKIELGIIDDLPQNLKKNCSYAVVDQIRTVNSSRFFPLFEGNKVKEVRVSSETMSLLYSAVVIDILYDADAATKQNVVDNLTMAYK